MQMVICKARTEDHVLLTELTIQSKAHWNYSQTQINSWAEVLTISAEYIDKNDVFKLVSDDQLIGYYSFYATSESEVLLDNMFISPKFIGKGLGRMLLIDFLSRVKAEGYADVLLYSDPNSEGFYRHFNFDVIGQEETTIEGRFLPIMKRSL